MAEFTVNTTRTDPFKNFKFLIRFEGTQTPVAGVSKVRPPRHSPGMSKFEPITFERGITFDLDFENWANLVYSTTGDAAVSLKNYKRNLVIDVLNLQGTKVKSYRVFRAWVSEFTALPQLDSNANATMIESLIVQNEGWERDESVQEVAET